jgi:putative peptidoglycan lipid II flippase
MRVLDLKIWAMVRSLFSTGKSVLSRQSSSILSAATIITLANLLSAVLGLVRNRLLVGQFFSTIGLREQLDAYWVAFRIPEFVFQLLVIGAMSAAFIPVYSKYRERNEEEANLMTSTMMNMVLLLFTGVSIVIFLFAYPFTDLITGSNFSAEQVALSANITRVMLLAQLCFAASNFMTGFIQAHHRFLLPALSPLAYNLGIILGIVFLTPILGIYGPAIGVVLGAVIHLLIQLPLARHLGFRFTFSLNWKLPGVREMWRFLPPRAMAISVDQLELFAAVFFTTALPAGSLSILNLAQQLMNAPTRVFAVPIGQASLPFLSKTAAQGEMEQFKRTLTQTLNQVLYLAFPAGALLLVLRIPLVRIVYGAAGFPWYATLITGKLVAIFALAIFAYGGIQVLTRGYYALHDTKTPFFVALISVVFSTTIMWVSTHFPLLGVLGIGLALSIATIGQFISLLTLMLYKYRTLDSGLLLFSQIRIVISAIIMGVALWVPMRLLDQWVFDTSRTLPLLGLTLCVGVIGGATYLLLTKLFNVPEFEAYVNLYSKFNRIKDISSPSDEVMPATSQNEDGTSW